MDSWTLQGDSYSFLRSAPRTFSLRHRDGTPNHVEIFDITNIPNHRSAISETTCLCDIFGDDCESPSHSSSPASGSVVPSQREVDGRAAASPLVDDLNDSSGSYHTAPGSSEGEEVFEDSRERLHSPTLQRENSGGGQSEGEGLRSGNPGVSVDTETKLEPNSKSPVPQLSTASPSAEGLNPSCGDRTPSPGYNNCYTLGPEGRVSSLSSSSVDTRSALSSPNPRQSQSAAESRSITPTSRDRHSSTSHQSSIHSCSPEPRGRVTSSSESVNILSLPESRGAQVSPEPRSIPYNHDSSPSPDSASQGFSLASTSPTFEPSTILSSNFPSSSSTELLSKSRELLVSPELKSRSYSPDTQASSPFSEIRRVSVPDIFSRGSTPDIENCPCTPELVSDPSAGRDDTEIPENQDSRLSGEPGSTVSTPAPRYTPPSPLTSLAPTPELRENNSVSPEVRCEVPSPGLLRTASPIDTWSGTPSPAPSPKITHISPSSETSPRTSSPVISFNLAPSPEVRKNYSPIEHRYTTPSPEIRITASSPEVRKKAQPSEVDLTSNSLDPHLDSTSSNSRSLTSSPHITGISYSVVQPEDRDTSPLPELSHLSTPEPGRTYLSPESRSPTPSRDSTKSSTAESTGTPRGSPHITGFTCTVLQRENIETLSPQPRYQTPSPEPKYHTPSPEPRYQTASSERHLTPSPQHRNRDPSPVAASPEPRCHQRSPVTPSTEADPEYTQPTLPLRKTPEVEGISSSIDITEIKHPIHEDRVSPSSQSDSGAKSLGTDIKSRSPVVKNPIHSPESTTSPVSAEKTVLDNLYKQQSTDRETTPREISNQYNSEEKPLVFQKEDPCNNFPIELQPPSPNLPVSLKNQSPVNSPAPKAISKVPVQRLEQPQPKFAAYTLNSDNRKINRSLKFTSTPQCSRRQRLPKVGSKTSQKLVEDMAHHVNRRRTPSPPLTRFTPVHIIAPEKPYRPWQNRSSSPSQVVASSLTGNLKKPVTNRESPNAALSDSNSQAYWVQQERELEMEREMQLEEERERERELDRERQRDREREMERERKREEQVPEKGEGWQGDASYRGEQVELSFSARNRKGPASRSTAPTSRGTRQGMPTARSYPESLLATRQLQQQQSLIRVQTSQQDTRVGGPSKWLQPALPQNKNTAPGRVAANRPCQSSSSSMGSELDEADNEVKWFTDLAFHSLSSPEVDYLDMYNSSHCSSTNISQPSTQESPAGANAAWLAYADFRGSAPKLDNEDFSFQHPSTYNSDGLDPSKRYELGSFECVDVAVEREDSRKARRGVPKRQIQLKRKNTAEMKQDESSDNSSPGVPMMVDSPSPQRHSRETLVRQHSTPAAVQESYHTELNPDLDDKNERKSKLQKSASLDETCTKTKMATCLIKSVLSKKMQSVDKQTEEHVKEEARPPSKDKTPPTENVEAPCKNSPKLDTHNLSSSLHSDLSLSSEDLGVRREPSTKGEVRLQKNFGVISSNRPSSNSSSTSFNLPQSDSEGTDPPCRNTASSRSEMRSELIVPFDSKQSTTEKVILKTGGKRGDDSERWEESEGGDSANATAGNTAAPFATEASSTQIRMTNRDQECEVVGTEDHKQLQQSDNKSTYMSKTPEITLKASPTAMEKKKTSLNVSLTPELENKPELQREAPSPEMCFRQTEERVETRVDGKTEEEQDNENNKVKAPIHKVRDVRRLVKNTYNLSFKATSIVKPSDENEGRTENSQEDRREEIKQERQEEIQVEKREAMQDLRRERGRKDMGEERKEEKREERSEELRVETKEEQRVEVRDTKVLTLSPRLQSKGKPLSHPQPMQIECKAVCWKEDKSKMTPSKTDSEKPEDKHQVSPHFTTETCSEPENSTSANTQSYKTEDAARARPNQPDPSMEVEMQHTKTETHKIPDSEDKPVVVRRDRKPPMLGSLPRLPSKEREVSTAVVVIREGSSKTKTSSSPAHEEIPTPLQAPSTSPAPESTSGTTPGSSSHSVSMLLKEKGYHADIGAVVGEGQNATASKGLPHKHVNRLEIPLQTATPSDGGQTESRRERTFSSSSTKSDPTALFDNTETLTKTNEEEGASNKPSIKDSAQQNNVSPQQQTPPQIKQGDFEAVKRQDPTFPPRSPAIRRFRPQPIEVKSLSKETQKQEMPTNNMLSSRPQAIEVKSIAKSSQKPVVPPKPNYKFKPTDLGTMPNESQKSAETTSSAKTQGEERPQTIVVSSPTIYRKISSDSTSASNYTRKLAVSAVSSYKPPPSKTTATTISSLSNRSTAPSETEASNDGAQQPQPGASPHSSRHTQRPTTLAAAPTSAKGSGLTSVPGLMPELTANQVPGPSSAVASQVSQPSVMDINNQPQYPRMAYPQDQAMPMTSINTKQPAAVSTTQAPGYRHTHQPCHRSLSNERSHRTDDLRYYASDDPPSYDERESFSPLMLPDLTPRRPNRYQPTSRPPPCSCTSGCHSHPGLPPPHHHHSPHNITPPGPSHSPGQALPYPVVQPPLRAHHCRPDPQPLSYRPSSPKASPLGPGQPPAMYQHLNQPPACPPHPSLMQPCPSDRPLQPPQHIDPRHPPVHRSPQHQPPGVSVAPYSEPGHSHSPSLAPMDPQYLCGPQSLGPSYGSEYGGDSSSLYSESSYGQTPRRVLMDPETGKYFYIEVPVQPLRKMLFDPETGQYVEVLIPQQTMSHSGLYPPSAAPYPSLHNPSMYAPAPQYLPYAAPPPPPHPPGPTTATPSGHPEASASAVMHQNRPGVGYGSPPGQGPKPEPQNHPPLDQSYLEGMYYVPTGMNASPNPTPPDCYHKHPPNLPTTGGKRS